MTKVADLSGTELDCWVARCLGWKLFVEDGRTWYLLFEQEDGTESPIGIVESGAVIFDDFHPSSDWSDGGPLIEKHIVALENNGLGDGPFFAVALGGMESGPTPLIAAMRALVACKFGEQVDDPS